MESLGGDQLWFDRFLAQHSAIVYYTVLLALFVVSPRLAYNFSELIEAHAVDTYGELQLRLVYACVCMRVCVVVVVIDSGSMHLTMKP